MSRAFKRLQSVLKLEAQQGYKNTSVVGGMRQLSTFWVTQARQEAVDEADKAFIEQTATALLSYDRLPSLEKRADLVQMLLSKIDARQKRVGQIVSAPITHPPTDTPQQSKVVKSTTPSLPIPPPVLPKSKQPIEEKKAAPPPPLPPRKRDGEQKTSERHQPTPQKSDPLASTQRKAESPPIPTPPPLADPTILDKPVTIIKGVGPKIAEQLERLGATKIRDLLYLFPRRHDDYTLMKPINRLAYGEQVTVIGTIWEVHARRTRTGEMVQAVVSDGTGQVQVTWFNQSWLATQLRAGMQVVLSGKVEQFMGRPAFNSPEWEPVATEPLKTRRIVPIYPLTEDLRSFKMRQIMQQLVTEYCYHLVDPMPASILQSNNLYSLPQAIQQIHFPHSQQTLHEARRRLIFDELFLLQLGMLGQRREWQTFAGTPITVPDETLNNFFQTLPFPLTNAQKRVISEIRTDITQTRPMNRLLQGDVGAGKTVIAAAAIVLTIESGYQAAMMAPTEILAEQHYRSLSHTLAPLGYTIGLLTGSTPTSQRAQLLEQLRAGSLQILIGTHALIQAEVQFHHLALVVIDEQHRFGVDQRQALRHKGTPQQTTDHLPLSPHLLVMTATPIPRTLALSLYGDLDLSILDELPPGRQEIKTRWLRPTEKERAYRFVRGQIEQGRQAFIICPLVEESDKIEAVAAVEEYTRLQNEIFPDLRLGLVHGRMKSDEKEAVMRAFYENQLQILVATAVIEVGIDVPNATVILIEGANRFGLAQLHQFRGRVGRGQHASYCILISNSTSSEAEMRLQAMEQTNDGFLLAEKDLELRGPGQFFGRQQSGLPEIQMASLSDSQSLLIARQSALTLFEQDPTLENPQHTLLRERVSKFWQNAGDVS